eukprot:gene19827-biopygen10064
MGRDVGPAFQRRYRDSPSSTLDVQWAETVPRHVDSKEYRILGILVVGSRTKRVIPDSRMFEKARDLARKKRSIWRTQPSIRTAARALRSGSTNDTDGLWE